MKYSLKPLALFILALILVPVRQPVAEEKARDTIALDDSFEIMGAVPKPAAVFITGLPFTMDNCPELEKIRNDLSTLKLMADNPPPCSSREQVLFLLAYELNSQNQLKAALQTLTEMAGEFPDSKLLPHVRLLSAETLYRLEQYDEARSMYILLAAGEDPNSLRTMIQYRLAWCEIEQGNRSQGWTLLVGMWDEAVTRAEHQHTDELVAESIIWLLTDIDMDGDGHSDVGDSDAWNKLLDSKDENWLTPLLLPLLSALNTIGSRHSDAMLLQVCTNFAKKFPLSPAIPHLVGWMFRIIDQGPEHLGSKDIEASMDTVKLYETVIDMLAPTGEWMMANRDHLARQTADEIREGILFRLASWYYGEGMNERRSGDDFDRSALLTSARLFTSLTISYPDSQHVSEALLNLGLAYMGTLTNGREAYDACCLARSRADSDTTQRYAADCILQAAYQIITNDIAAKATEDPSPYPEDLFGGSLRTEAQIITDENGIKTLKPLPLPDAVKLWLFEANNFLPIAAADPHSAMDIVSVSSTAALICARFGHLDRARWWLQKALDLTPAEGLEAEQLHAARIAFFALEENWDEVARYTALVKSDPDVIRRTLAQMLRKGAFAPARTLCKEALPTQVSEKDRPIRAAQCLLDASWEWLIQVISTSEEESPLTHRLIRKQKWTTIATIVPNPEGHPKVVPIELPGAADMWLTAVEELLAVSSKTGKENHKVALEEGLRGAVVAFHFGHLDRARNLLNSILPLLPKAGPYRTAVLQGLLESYWLEEDLKSMKKYKQELDSLKDKPKWPGKNEDKIEDPASVSGIRAAVSGSMGGTTRKSQMRNIRQRRGQVVKCYTQQLRLNPDLPEGKIVLKITIDEKGKAAVEVTTDELGHGVADCILKRMQKWRWDKPATDDETTFIVPFSFRQ